MLSRMRIVNLMCVILMCFSLRHLELIGFAVNESLSSGLKEMDQLKTLSIWPAVTNKVSRKMQD